MTKRPAPSPKKSGKQVRTELRAESVKAFQVDLGASEAENEASQEVEAILARLETGIAREHDAMDELLRRLRTTRIAA